MIPATSAPATLPKPPSATVRRGVRAAARPVREALMTAATTTLAPGSGLARAEALRQRGIHQGQDQDVLQVDVGDAVGQRGEAREDHYLAVVFVRPQGLFGRL
jgi:hypothetical protein